jgi:hypothetical protein
VSEALKERFEPDAPPAQSLGLIDKGDGIIKARAEHKISFVGTEGRSAFTRV